MPTQPNPSLEAADLSKSYGSHLALNRLNLRVEAGEIYCMLGGNGAGKTTTIHLFLNFIKPSGGRATVLGVEVSKHPHQARSKMTYIPEQVALYPDLNGLENLRYLLTLSGLDSLTEGELSRYLEQAGLDSSHHRQKVAGYSKGMRQKVGVGLALAKRSEVLLLDEPTSGLDPASANDFSNIVSGLAEQGAAVFMVTHDLFRVKQISHRVGIMRAGELVEERHTAELETEELEKLYLQHMRN